MAADQPPIIIYLEKLRLSLSELASEAAAASLLLPPRPSTAPTIGFQLGSLARATASQTSERAEGEHDERRSLASSFLPIPEFVTTAPPPRLLESRERTRSDPSVDIGGGGGGSFSRARHAQLVRCANSE